MPNAQLTPQQEARILEALVQWHEAGRGPHNKHYSMSTYDNLNGLNFKHHHVGGKYIRLDEGSSGAWMVDIESGTIYGIMGYGRPDKRKIAGNLWNPAFDGAQLYKDRWTYGKFDRR